MKKSLNLIIVALVLLIAACGGNKQTQDGKENQDSIKKNLTIENLKAAFQGESNASAKYAAFAKKAMEEKLPMIAALFNTASKSESIHAANHLKVLTELGATDTAKIGNFEVKTTLENLEAAFNGEKHEVDEMYPGFINQGQTDKNDNAVKSFTWAFDTEKKHMSLYQAAIDALKAKKEKSLPTGYFICPKCGFTYSSKDVQEACEICGTAKENFIIIK